LRGLTPEEKSILEDLHRPIGPCNEVECVPWNITQMSMAVINQLIERGLIVKSPCGCNDKLAHISITPTGVYVLDLIKSEVPKELP
jgi:hypothetical protein